jgi:ribosomal protein S18 acetylase RimI-like enzyme
MDYLIRRADLADLEQLVEFTLSEAEEAEGTGQDGEKARRGIRRALEDESVALYWVIEDRNEGLIGNISVVREWSNWKAGDYWWIQSLYLKPAHRGRGLLITLLETVRKAAVRGQALDLRLYVHKNNERAIKAYRKAGFLDADYRIMRMGLPAASKKT